MTISRRLRFEILRRDNYVCRYCGASAPDAVLQVDHVVPVALGGSDEAGNLTTACKDCNAGKSSVPADAPTVDAVDHVNTSWKRALEAAAAEMESTSPLLRNEVEAFDKAWTAWHIGDGEVPRDPNWAASIAAWADAGLTTPMLLDLIPLAMSPSIDGPWRYFCGCAWRQLRELHELAASMLATETATALEDEFLDDLARRDARLGDRPPHQPTAIGEVLRRLAEEATSGT